MDAFDELRGVNLLLHESVVHVLAVLIEASNSYSLLDGLQSANVFSALEFFLHLAVRRAEDVKHHSDHNVEDDPLNEDVEDHEENARPDLTGGIHHHVCDRGPIVNDHE